MRQPAQHTWEVASLPAGGSLHMLSGTGCQAGLGLRLPEHLVGGAPRPVLGREGFCAASGRSSGRMLLLGRAAAH